MESWTIQIALLMKQYNKKKHTDFVFGRSQYRLICHSDIDREKCAWYNYSVSHIRKLKFAIKGKHRIHNAILFYAGV